MEKIIVTGCNGQLGRAINKELPGDKYELINTDVFQGEGIIPLDITNVDAVVDLARKTKASAIINCAAYTAETEPDHILNLIKQGLSVYTARLSWPEKRWSNSLQRTSL